MRFRWPTVVLMSLTITLYLATVVAGLQVKDLSMYKNPIQSRAGMAWTPPSESSIPNDPHGDSIRRGALLFDETPLYADRFTRAKVSCSSCHAAGGMQPFASPVVGLPALFPMYNARAGHVIGLEDRIEECFVRSENGAPIDYKGPQMRALVDYINWLSTPEPGHRRFYGRGLVSLPDLKPDAARGAAIYAAQCAGCHGQHGEGKPPLFPPVWGPDSFNDGAGIDGIPKMAAFVQHNMPQNRMGILSPQEAYDVAAFLHAQPRPTFDPAYRHF